MAYAVPETTSTRSRRSIGIRLRDVIGVDNMMWGSDYGFYVARLMSHA